MEPRNSQFVLSMLKSMLSGGGSDPALSRQFWMPDSRSVACYDCTSKFTHIRRRHHCRVCGQVFCSKCCNSYIPGKHVGASGSLRVCKFCHECFVSNLNQLLDDTAGLTVQYHPARRQSMDVVAELANSPNTSRPTRKTSVGLELYGSTGAERSMVVPEHQETVKLKDPASLTRLWEGILDKEKGIKLELHRSFFRSYQDTFQASKLVDWLVGRDTNTSRSQAVAIAQALLAAGFFVGITQTVFADNSEIYRPCDPPTVEASPIADLLPSPSADQSLQEPLWLQELGEAPSGFQVGSSPTNSSTDSSSGSTARSAEISGATLSELRMGISDLRESVNSGVNIDTETRALDSAYLHHESNYLDRLAGQEKLTTEWRQILLQLGDQTVRTVVPDLRQPNIDMDIRAHVKVKKIPGGEKMDSRLLHGEVCTLKLAHRAMASQLLNPRIALVANSIMFQREESRMTCLDTLTMQEEDYIKNVTGRLLQSRPNLVLVEKTVARLAQEIFLREGVSLALNVKIRVLERLERLTGARIIPSIDSMLTSPTLGTCHHFYTMPGNLNPPSASSRKRGLMVFAGCPPDLGGTIILQGGTKPELARLKAVFKRLLLLKYSWRHERSFILNEYGWIKGSHREIEPAEDAVESDLSDLSDRLLSLGGEAPNVAVAKVGPTINGPEEKLNVVVHETPHDEALARTEAWIVAAKAAGPIEYGPDSIENGANNDVGGLVHEAREEVPVPATTEAGIVVDTTAETEIRNNIIASDHGTVEVIAASTEAGIGAEASVEDYKARLVRFSIPPLVLDISDDDPAIGAKSVDTVAVPQAASAPSVVAASATAAGVTAAEANSACGYQLAISPFIKVPAGADQVAADAMNTSKNLIVVAVANPEISVNGIILESEPTESSAVKDKNDMSRAELGGQERHPWCRQFIESTSVHNHLKDCAELRDQLALFRAAGWRLNSSEQHRSNSYLLPPSDCDIPVVVPPLPEDHCEVMSLLFCSYAAASGAAPHYCIAPWVVRMGLFGNYDVSLGMFLESFCFAPDYSCPNRQCTVPIVEHIRRFCHAGGAVLVTMQRLVAPVVEKVRESRGDRLVIWKYCNVCHLITPIVPVTEDTWSMSFALFLHLMLHESSLLRRGADRPDAMCTHSLHQEHITCFGKGDLVVYFKYIPVVMRQLVTPCHTPVMPPSTSSRESLLTKLRTLKKQGSGMYSSVLEKLYEMKKGESGIELADMYQLKQEEQFKDYRERVELIEEKILSMEHPQPEMLKRLCELYRDLILAQAQWNKHLAACADPNHRKKLATTTSSESTEANGLPAHSRKQESDTTVKKLISTILPQSEEVFIPSPFPQDVHLVTSEGGVPMDPPSPYTVLELEPASLIYYLLMSDTYRQFLSGSSEPNSHLELQFSSETAQFYTCSYFTREFHQLRELVFPGRTEDFVNSLANSRRWEAMGGKSGLLFFKTKDDRFIMKQMSRFECQSFSEFAPHYFQYITECIEKDTPTLLCKIVGVYKIGFKNATTGAGLKMDVLIIENLFYAKKIAKSYDLKGSVRNRLTITEGKNERGQVLLDENFVRGSCESPLYINERDKALLVDTVKRDTAFLAQHHMMDYSLLAGICRNSEELVVGIIDYIRTFTWDKKLETLVKSVKSSGVFGGPAQTPTVVNPELYRTRFTAAMDSYFLLVPD